MPFHHCNGSWKSEKDKRKCIKKKTLHTHTFHADIYLEFVSCSWLDADVRVWFESTCVIRAVDVNIDIQFSRRLIWFTYYMVITWEIVGWARKYAHHSSSPPLSPPPPPTMTMTIHNTMSVTTPTITSSHFTWLIQSIFPSVYGSRSVHLCAIIIFFFIIVIIYC